MRFIRANEITIPPRTGIAPPHSPVPAPRGAIAAPQSFAIRTTALASRASRGRTTTSGGTLSL